MACIFLGAPLRTAGAMILLAAGAAGAAEPSSIVAVRLRVRETAFARGDTESSRARSRVVLDAALPSDERPSSLALRVGGFAVDVPLRNGRFDGRIALPSGSVAASVSVRRRRLVATLRSRTRDGASIFGERVARAAADEQATGGTAYGLEAASLSIDGIETALALGLAARFDVVPRPGREHRAPGPGDLFRAEVHGAAVTAGAPPVVQIIGSAAGETWNGRIRGHALGAGSRPFPVAALNDGPPAHVQPLDAEARSFGSDTVFEPGVRSVVAGGETFYQVRFDMAVQAMPGPQRIAVAVLGPRGFEDKVVVRFDAPLVAAPTDLDADLHVLEARRDQTLWAWGENLFGQVGDGTRLNPVSPVPLPEPSAVRAVAAGGEFSLALDLAGRVWLWGEWDSTRVSDGVGISRNVGSRTPALVEDLAGGVVSIAAGEDHALALDGEGSVWAFGENYAGQLGDGTFTDHAKHPQRVKKLPRIRGIAAGETSLALDEDGAVWTWGEQFLAGIGDGTRPVRVEGLPRIRDVSAGGIPLALAEEGTVWTWGRNFEGALGDGTETDRDTPVLVSGLTGVASIDAGAFHSLAVRADGTVWAWGYNGCGELGDGTSVDRNVPVRVRDLAGITAVAAGPFASLAVDAIGAVWVWGAYEFQRGAVGEDSGIYPVLARRDFVPGHIPPGRVFITLDAQRAARGR